jgi:hypothetical protein
MTAAVSTKDRVRLHRQRRKSGACVLSFVLVDDEIALVDLLVAAGLLAESERDDRAALSRAAGRALSAMARDHQM